MYDYSEYEREWMHGSTPEPQKSPKSIFAGMVVAVLLFVFLGQYVITGSYGHWHKEIAYHKTHLTPGWARRTGTVQSVQAPNFADDPPDVSASVSFVDWFGTSQSTGMTLPYRTRAGNTVTVYASSSGRIYSPQNIANQYSETPLDPSSALPGFFPFGALVVYGFLDLLVCAVVWFMVSVMAEGVAHIPVSKFKGRLGSR